MQRTTIMAEESVLDRLRGLADERGVTFAAVVREALADKAESYHPVPKFIGMFESSNEAEPVDWDTVRVPPRSWR